MNVLQSAGTLSGDLGGYGWPREVGGVPSCRSTPPLVENIVIPAETLSGAPLAAVHGGYLGGLDVG
jgi:hypothetical protein